MPAFPAAEADHEANLSIGIDRRRIARCHPDGDLAAEILVAVNRSERSIFDRPPTCRVATVDDFSRLDLEQICEVAADLNFEVELGSVLSVVDDINILMHSPVDRAAEGQQKRTGRYGVLFRADFPVGQKYARGVVVEISAIEQFPGRSVGANAPAAHEPCVAKIKALPRLEGNLAIRFSDENGVSLVGGDVRWPNRDLEHRCCRAGLRRSRQKYARRG